MDYKKILTVAALSGLIAGLEITTTDPYTPKLFGILLLLGSSVILYFTYIKSHKVPVSNQNINFKQSFLGLLLIVIDVSYNLLVNDPFKYFDIAMLFSGMLILTLNLGFLDFLKIDKNMASFTTYFLFITMGLYAFLFTGLDLLLGSSDGSNPFWTWFNKNVVYVSMPFLNLVRPTTVSGSTINFDGFNVAIGYACSGIESISVFFAAVIAYFFAKKERNVFKACKYMFIGGIALYMINILRVIIIILVGYFRGVDDMMFVHTHLGWIFFVIGMSVFWYLVFNDTAKE
jgi:archaeosortase C (PEF-CTERM variant)